jgi:hypothetical protein
MTMSNDTNDIATILAGLTVAPKVEQYIAALNAAAIEYADKRGYSFHDVFTVVRLAKYVKIVASTEYEAGKTSNTHVHAFVDPTTGDVFKPAGWKAPAKGARFNLNDEASMARLLSVVDGTGGYLYIR